MYAGAAEGSVGPVLWDFFVIFSLLGYSDLCFLCVTLILSVLFLLLNMYCPCYQQPEAKSFYVLVYLANKTDSDTIKYCRILKICLCSAHFMERNHPVSSLTYSTWEMNFNTSYWSIIFLFTLHCGNNHSFIAFFTLAVLSICL